MLKNILNLLKTEMHWKILGKAFLSLLPAILGYLWTGNSMFWNIGLVTISLGVGAERLKLGMPAISLHFLLIFVGFTILFFAYLSPYIFVLTCAAMAFGTIYFTRHGAQIRTLANYTFIPTVYLTCELHEHLAPALSLSAYEQFIALLPIAWIMVMVIYGIPRVWAKPSVGVLTQQSKLRKGMSRILHGVELGEPEILWMAPAIAIFLGVLIAAGLVIFFHISRGEWVIWSVASVITLEFASTRRKFTDRMLGALIGVPLGIVAAQFVPQLEWIYSIAVLGIMLTLVAFKRYRLAFGSRCFLVAFAAVMVSSTTTVAIERVANVFLGGLIGVIAVYITGFIFSKIFLKYKKR